MAELKFLPKLLENGMNLIMENNKDKTDDILEKLVHINRITKVVKGGRFGFSALVVVEIKQEKLVLLMPKPSKFPTQ